MPIMAIARVRSSGTTARAAAPTLSFGAGAADDATARSMHADKAKRDQEVKTLYEAGPPNIFDYIKD